MYRRVDPPRICTAHARAAALRQPELAGIDSHDFEHAMRIQIRQNAERDQAILEVAEITLQIHRLAGTAPKTKSSELLRSRIKTAGSGLFRSHCILTIG